MTPYGIDEMGVDLAERPEAVSLSKELIFTKKMSNTDNVVDLSY